MTGVNLVASTQSGSGYTPLVGIRDLVGKRSWQAYVVLQQYQAICLTAHFSHLFGSIFQPLYVFCTCVLATYSHLSAPFRPSQRENRDRERECIEYTTECRQCRVQILREEEMQNIDTKSKRGWLYTTINNPYNNTSII